MEISSAVMLTLTKDNMGQIIELADFLKDKAEYFTFNRLSPVGQGAQLQLPDKEDFYQFIKQYVTESEKNPIMGYKDNLINIELSRRGWQLLTAARALAASCFQLFCNTSKWRGTRMP